MSTQHTFIVSFPWPDDSELTEPEEVAALKDALADTVRDYLGCTTEDLRVGVDHQQS